MYKQAEYNWSNCIDEKLGNAVVIRAYDEKTKWQEFTKKASENATYKQLYDAANIVKKQLGKQKKEYIISIWVKGKLTAQLRSRLFSSN